MTSNRKKNRGRIATIALLTIIGAGLSAAALAQNAVTPPPTPQDDSANSAAAMKDTVHDPRIDNSQTGRGDWGMWDIGRPHPMKGKGAFDDHDPIGVAAGKLIPTDCSLYWSDPDTHRILCFGSQASLVYFLAAPKTNTARAEKAWRTLKGTTS
jgi:hypothetical protein